MNRLRTRRVNPAVLYFGTPVALVTTLNSDQSTNISPMSSVWALGHRLILGLGRDGHAFTNLNRVGECVVNLPSQSDVATIERIAPTTGSLPVPRHKAEMGYRHEPDKFGLSGLTPIPSIEVAPHRIAECPLQIEATLLKINELSALPGESIHHDVAVVEAHARVIHAHESILIEDSDHIDPTKWKPLLYVWRQYFSTGPRLGRNFRDTQR